MEYIVAITYDDRTRNPMHKIYKECMTIEEARDCADRWKKMCDSAGYDHGILIYKIIE